MLVDGNKGHAEFGCRVGELMRLSPDAAMGYQAVSAANSATSKLGERGYQLISPAGA